MKLHRVILLPDSVLPADLAYGALITALGPDIDAVAKGLELYEPDEPPADYSLDTKVAGVLREADARGWDTFHLVGYSGGGAAALASAQRHPEQLASLALRFSRTSNWRPSKTGTTSTRPTGSNPSVWPDHCRPCGRVPSRSTGFDSTIADATPRPEPFA